MEDYVGESVPLYRTIMYAKKNSENVQAWFNEQDYDEELDYECELRFNSGNPAFFIRIYNPDLLTLFTLRWS